ncbi:hypothetical protein MRX96_016402 [Rhipicephalus microplus]
MQLGRTSAIKGSEESEGVERHAKLVTSSGRTEVRVWDIVRETRQTRGPITKQLRLFEVDQGEVVIRLDLHIFES